MSVAKTQELIAQGAVQESAVREQLAEAMAKMAGEALEKVGDTPGDKVNRQYGTNVDFAALSELEGGQRDKGYLPMRYGKILGKSGITIATGFDTGQHSKEEIKRMKFPKALEDKLLPFAGVKKEAAIPLVPLAEKTKLTKEEANLIDHTIFSKHIEPAIRAWNSHRLKDTPEFTKLTRAQQTVLMSRTYHQGRDMPTLEVSQAFFQAAIKGHWEEAATHLRNYNVKEGWYKGRVRKEADYLMRERLQK